MVPSRVGRISIGVYAVEGPHSFETWKKSLPVALD